jgi:tetratricopeptide (TPR) repeat protein/DNA-binding beta-propeller fold protein YncE
MKRCGVRSCLAPGIILLMVVSGFALPGSGFENVDFLFETGGPKAGKGSGQFDSPEDIAVAADGSIYVTDSGNSRVQYFDSKGTYQGQFGGKGKDRASLSHPFGIVISTDGKVYVSDKQDNVIKVYDRKGGFLFSFGEGLFKSPCGIAIDNQERALVADSGSDRIALFSLEGVLLHYFGKTGAARGELKEPCYITVDNSGRIHVSEKGNNRVQVFDAEGKSVAIYDNSSDPSQPLEKPAGVSVTSRGIIAIVDNTSGQIAMVDQEGNFKKPFGSPGSSRGQFKDAGGVKLLDDGRLFVADTANNRIQGFKTVLPTDVPELPPAPVALRLQMLKVMPGPVTDVAVTDGGTLYILDSDASSVHVVDMDGARKFSFGPGQGLEGHLKKATGIAQAEDGRVYVYDEGDDTFKVFDKIGRFKYSFGGHGKNDGKFDKAEGFCLGKDKLYVADTGNQRVQVFSMDGIFLLKFGEKGDQNGQFNFPCDVALDSNGMIYVADCANHRIQKLDSKGNFKFKLGEQGEGESQFNALRAIAVNANDFVFAMESDWMKNNRVQVFDKKHFLVLTFGSEGSGPGQFRKSLNMFVRSGAFSEVYVPDSGNQRLLIFAVKEVPDRPMGLALESLEDSTKLSWKRRPESFVKSYRVYYLPEDGSDSRLLGETEDISFTIKYPLEPPGYSFRVTSVTAQGLESTPSRTVRDNFQVGYLAWRAGEYEIAENKLLIHQNEFPSNAISLKYLGEVRMAMCKEEDAVRAYIELAKVPGYAGKAHLELGRLYSKLGQYSKAEAELIKALEKDKDNPEVSLARAELLIAQDLFRDAQRDLERAIALDPQNGKAYELLGLCFFEQKLLKKAAENYDRAIQLNPDDTSLYHSLARAQLGRGDIPGAMVALQNALEINPGDSEAMVMLGEIHLGQKEYAKVERQINLVLEKHPKHFQAYLLRGRMLADLGQHEDAILALQDATNLRPDDPEALQALASVYLKMKQYQEAEKILKQVLKISPTLAAAHLDMARVLAQKGDSSGAVSEFQKAIELAPKDINGHLELGRHYLEIKQYGQAEVAFQRAISLVPDHVRARLLLGRTYALENKIGDAIREFQEGINIDPKSAQARFELGKLYLDTGQFDKAISELELAAFTLPHVAEYQNQLGLAYFKMLRHDEAIEAFQRALELKPDNPEYKKNFNQVYEDRQKYLASDGNLPPLEITDVQIEKMFSAIYKYYQDDPVGSFKLKNNSSDTLYKLKASFLVKDYMDSEWYHEIPQIKPHGTAEVKIFPVFNNKVLELTEDTPVLADISVSYQVQKQPRQEKITKPFTILKKSALTWTRKETTGAFITPSDWPVKEFARGVYNLYSKDKFPVNEQTAHAMMTFDALNAYRMNYLVDPHNPYGSASGEEAVDYVQYPRETLRLRSGDCDDLSILFCALLENLGIHTAMLDVPGHVFIMFETQTLAQNADMVSSNPDLLVLHEGKVWIPLETTMVGQTEFTSAWIKGADVYRQWHDKGKLNIIDTHESWKAFKPATLPTAEFQPHLPSRAEIDAILDKEKGIQESKQKDLIAGKFKEKLNKNPEDIDTRIQLGIAYAENGYLEDAKAEFTRVLEKDSDNIDAISNLGSCALAENDYKAAVSQYSKAEKLAPEDAEVKINLAIAYYKDGKLDQARAKFKDAKALDAALAEQFKTLQSMLFH